MLAAQSIQVMNSSLCSVGRDQHVNYVTNNVNSIIDPGKLFNTNMIRIYLGKICEGGQVLFLWL
jgi:hypothetical protein